MQFEENKLQHDFPKMRTGVKGRLEIFQKLIRFGVVTRPLGTKFSTKEAVMIVISIFLQAAFLCMGCALIEKTKEL